MNAAPLVRALPLIPKRTTPGFAFWMVDRALLECLGRRSFGASEALTAVELFGKTPPKWCTARGRSDATRKTVYRWFGSPLGPCLRRGRRSARRRFNFATEVLTKCAHQPGGFEGWSRYYDHAIRQRRTVAAH